MYEKYFSTDELRTLPLHTEPDVLADWGALIGDVQAAMDRDTTPADATAHKVAQRWMTMIERRTGNNPAFLTRLREMNESEPGLRQRSGITRELEQFVERSMVAGRLVIFDRYLEPHEMERMRANYGRQMHASPPLIAKLRQAIAESMPVEDPRAQQMARRWMELFRAYAGDDPVTHARIREAYAAEPELRSGSAVDGSLLDYVRQSLTGLSPKSQ